MALLAVIPLAGLFASLVLGGSLLQAPAPTPAADPDLGPAVTRPAAVVAEPEPEAAAVTVVDSLAAEHAP